MAFRSLFRYDDGVLPNTIALTYATVGHVAGLAMLLSRTWWIEVPGLLLVAHSLVIGAYLIHDLAHNAIFRRPAHAALLGRLFLWMSGSAWTRYADVRKAHLDHHAKHADVLCFDFHRFLDERPWARRVTTLLEWLFIPAVDILMRGQRFVVGLRRGGEERRRVLLVLASRAAFFGGMAAISPRGCALYVIAQGLFMHVLRFMDAHQHTYEVLVQEPGRPPPVLPERDKEYEDQHTYSNVLSLRRRWLNLLTLNFGYHNAHHARPAQPWHRLPAVHAALYEAGVCHARCVLPASSLLGNYVKNRVQRAVSGAYGHVGDGPRGADTFIGAVGVSFLY